MKTKSSLEFLFDQPEMVEHGQEYMDQLLEQDKENYIDCFLTDISWLDYYNLNDYIKEYIEETIVYPDGDTETNTLHFYYEYSSVMAFEYVNGYHLFHKVGDTIKGGYLDTIKESIPSYDIEGLNKEYTFIGCAGNLGQEIEIQAENGNCAYYYIGERYFEVWIDSRFYKSLKDEI